MQNDSIPPRPRIGKSTRRRPAPERFWEKVDKSGDCWLWTGGIFGPGYGAFSPTRRNQVCAHRFSWELAFGPIPDGKNVCHRCDVRLCVNPAHLFIATQAENLEDARQKGRMPTAPPTPIPTAPHRGERHGMAKLTGTDVRAIRARVAAGERRRVVAAEFHISESLVGLIATRRRWGHIE